MATLTEGLEEHVTCGICLEQYKDPRILPCLHTYCRHCLENLITKSQDNKMVACPECHVKAELTLKEVSLLKVNFWVNNFLSLRTCNSGETTNKVELTCECCDSKETATGKCTDCCEFMCHFCVAAHQRMRATKQHNIMTLDDIKTAGPRAMEKPSFCSKHKGEVLKLFCETCEELICRDCTIVDHRNHKYLFTYDIIQNEKETIKDEVKKAVEKVFAVEAALISVREMQRRIEVKTHAVKEAVDRFFDKQMQVLESMRTDLKEKVTIVHKDRTKRLTAQEDDLSIRLTSFKSSIGFAKRVLKDGSDNNVLSIKKEVVSHLSYLASRSFDSEPCQVDAVKLVVDRDVWKSITKAAGIDDCYEDPQQCTISMVGGEPGVVYSTFAGQSYEFRITVNDQFGRKFKQERVVAVEVINKSTETAITLDVKKKDDTYSAMCQPLLDGEHRIAVMVGGKHIKGSPFTWMVNKKQTDVLATSFSQHSFLQTSLLELNETVSWKVKLTNVKNIYDLSMGPPATGISFSRCNEAESHAAQIQIGIEKRTTPEGYCRQGVPSKTLKWFWCNGQKYLPGQNQVQPSQITSLEEGDVFVVYLNKKASSMIICNSRTGQSDVFKGIDIPVFPHLYPLNRKICFSLDV